MGTPAETERPHSYTHTHTHTLADRQAHRTQATAEMVDEEGDKERQR